MNYSIEDSPGAWARAKVDRATAHYLDLRARVNAWIESKPYGVEPVIAEDRLSWQAYLRISNSPPLVEWATILGDCLHNLRSALDAGVWELAHVDDAAPLNPRLVQFPFCESAGDWERRLERSLAGLPADLLKKIEAIQPYNHSEGGERMSALSLLNTLDIEDKHKAGISAEIRAADASSRSQIRFESEEAALRHVRPRPAVALELTDGALLHDEPTIDPIVEIRGDLDVTVVFTIGTPRGPATIWQLLDLVFEATIMTLEHMYADA